MKMKPSDLMRLGANGPIIRRDSFRAALPIPPTVENLRPGCLLMLDGCPPIQMAMKAEQLVGCFFDEAPGLDLTEDEAKKLGFGDSPVIRPEDN